MRPHPWHRREKRRDVRTDSFALARLREPDGLMIALSYGAALIDVLCPRSPAGHQEANEGHVDRGRKRNDADARSVDV